MTILKYITKAFILERNRGGDGLQLKEAWLKAMKEEQLSSDGNFHHCHLAFLFYFIFANTEIGNNENCLA